MITHPHSCLAALCVFSRLCGALFCGTCSRFRVDVDKFNARHVRCCVRCFGALQSMTMSNSLSLWEEPGTIEPPPEKRWAASGGLDSTRATTLADVALQLPVVRHRPERPRPSQARLGAASRSGSGGSSSGALESAASPYVSDSDTDEDDYDSELHATEDEHQHSAASNSTDLKLNQHFELLEEEDL